MSTDITNYENYNIIPNAIKDFSKDTILSVYSDMCRLRKFEEVLIKTVNKLGESAISRVHLSTGQEAVCVSLAHVFPKDIYFVTHRCIELFISLGVPLEGIRDEILCLDTGYSKGKAASLFSYIKDDIKIFSHTGFIGEQIPIATGYALANGEKTICITGDGGAEEDYALQAYGFAATHKLPILFICNDNDLSIESTVNARRSWELCDIAKSFGMKAIDITDDPFTLMKIFKDFDNQMPAFINVRVNREYCHSGIKRTRIPKWDRFLIIREQIKKLGYNEEIEQIEKNATEEMTKLWEKYL